MSTRFRPALAVAGLFGLAVVSGSSSYGLASMMRHASKAASATSSDITASVTPAENTAKDKKTGTGLPLPRFVTLKADKVNVRRGPSSDHPVAFVFQRKGMPVEITAEFENWRKIRDSDGAEGWILQSMLSGRRNAFVASWSGNNAPVDLHATPQNQSGVSARLAPGVLATISNCDGSWCEVSTGDYTGYAEQARLWGVYPGEVVD
jgi:SH3-like domain-containing protein